MSVSMAATFPQGAESRSEQCLVETERLLIRKLTRADLPTLVQLFGCLDVMRFSLTGPLASPQVAHVLDQILASYQESPLGLWGVVEKTEQCLIGLCGFLRRKTGKPDAWELAYRFLPKYWGRGLGTEVAAACRD
ncbi:MAG: putative acetyltransferase, partial [Planctomycetaceae bacterium]|nr:putative acetyltransferase [Planctomycetaceae bacterium]